MVGQVPLEHFVQVRILVAQPEFVTGPGRGSPQVSRITMQTSLEDLVKTDTIEAVGVATPNLAAAPVDGAKTKSQSRRSRVSNEDRRFKVFSGSANRELAEEICKHIGVTLGETRMQRFSDGEVYFQLLENVRGADVFVVQPTCWPVDQHLVELLIMIDALKRASAGRITVVVPYYGYARQDRKDRPRVAISSKLVADLLTTAGANRALFMDLHAAQIQGVRSE